jgi:hypothetical protein
MQIGEAKISALVVAALTGLAVTVTLAQAVGLATALSISLPSAGVMGLVMFLLANDNIKKKGGDKPLPKEKVTEGK